jgi:hypothetical protein
VHTVAVHYPVGRPADGTPSFHKPALTTRIARDVVLRLVRAEPSGPRARSSGATSGYGMTRPRTSFTLFDLKGVDMKGLSR